MRAFVGLLATVIGGSICLWLAAVVTARLLMGL